MWLYVNDMWLLQAGSTIKFNHLTTMELLFIRRCGAAYIRKPVTSMIFLSYILLRSGIAANHPGKACSYPRSGHVGTQIAVHSAFRPH